MRIIRYIHTLVLLCLAVIAKSAEGRYYAGNKMSSGFITCVEQDDNGFVWIGTNYGLNRFDGYRFVSYFSSSADSLSLADNAVNALYTDTGGHLWVGGGHGLSLYDAARDCFRRVPLPGATPYVSAFAEDSRGNILVGTLGFGLYSIKKGGTTAVRVSRYSDGANDDYYQCMYFDTKGRFWKADNLNTIKCFVETAGGCRVVAGCVSQAGRVMRFVDDGHGGVVAVCQYGVMHFDGRRWQRLTGGKQGAVYNCACRMSGSGGILLGTSGGGIYILRGGEIVPSQLLDDNQEMKLANISVMFEDRMHNLWVGCTENGLACIPGQAPLFGRLLLSRFNIKNSVVQSLCSTYTGDILLTLSGRGLYRLSANGSALTAVDAPQGANLIYRDTRGRYWMGANKSLYSCNFSTGSITQSRTFDCIYLRTMTDDGTNLYISVFGQGLCIMDAATGRSRTLSMFDNDDARRGRLCNDWVLELLRDSQGMIWIGTTSGVQCYDPSSGSLRPYGWHNRLDGKSVMALGEDGGGNIIMGTDNGLYLYNRKTKKTTTFPGAEKLRDVKINDIVCSGGGHVWCSTSKGLWHYNPQKRSFTAYMDGNGLYGHEYLEDVGMLMPGGKIFFGVPDGAVIFNPQKVSKSVYRAMKPVLTNIMVGGKPVNVSSQSDGRSIIDVAVQEARNISLSYTDNVFALEFSSFDFANIDNVQLEYRLGKEKWTTCREGQNTINFSHLAPGSYRLEVRINNHGTVSPSSRWHITIRPPWYLTMPAYLIYLLAVTAIVAAGVYSYHRRRRRAMEEEKMQFLINATHDIRTPLTLILNPLHQLMSQEEGKLPQNIDKLQTINHNANRILTLVNQILDIRKMDKLQMRLHCRRTSLVQLIADVCRTFDYNAEKRGIDFRFSHQEDVSVLVDRIQFDKVLTNLLSNAFKYTPDGGSIVVLLNTDGGNAVIEVADSGIGLKDGDTERIFKRFYQSVATNAEGREGTGIGLNLCKMIMDMHHGTITAANRTDGQGSVFRVTLPLGSAHLKPEDIVEEVEAQVGQTKKPGTNYRVMLVDDDPEITDYISNELARYYHFTVCRNGKQAIGELLSGKFDLVVSDVMMPEMDGFTLLRMIKTNSIISHLPVILLTTEAAVGNRLEGLERGADAFLAKPFMLNELRATIDNLIEGRLKLKGKFSGAQQQSDKVEQQDIADNDKELMERIMKSINKNIGDSDFNVEMLCQDICVSRTQLHRKMKELTGLSTSEFIRNIRLEQAARLLKERHVNVSQVAYTLGFTNTAHFSKVFKQHFGTPPSEYGRHEGGESDGDGN